jgi:hypothetical protein
MKSVLLSALGAILSLRASEALAKVICDPKHNPEINGINTYIPSVGALSEVTGHCIDDICASSNDADSITKKCGPISLTITHLSAPLFDVKDCINGFNSIVDHCIPSKGIHGGIFETEEVIYNVLAVG